MYLDSKILSSTNHREFTFLLFDSCFGVSRSSDDVRAGKRSHIQFFIPAHKAILTSHNVEACAVAMEYNRRGLNVAHAMARFYSRKRIKLGVSKDSTYRRMMDQRQILDEYIPQLRYTQRIYKNMCRYYIEL